MGGGVGERQWGVEGQGQIVPYGYDAQGQQQQFDQQQWGGRQPQQMMQGIQGMQQQGYLVQQGQGYGQYGEVQGQGKDQQYGQVQQPQQQFGQAQQPQEYYQQQYQVLLSTCKRRVNGGMAAAKASVVYLRVWRFVLHLITDIVSYVAVRSPPQNCGKASRWYLS